jgi:hypothetical protein
MRQLVDNLIAPTFIHKETRDHELIVSQISPETCIIDCLHRYIGVKTSAVSVWTVSQRFTA